MSKSESSASKAANAREKTIPDGQALRVILEAAAKMLENAIDVGGVGTWAEAEGFTDERSPEKMERTAKKIAEDLRARADRIKRK